jgi:preprotein translocase subunit YajC
VNVAANANSSSGGGYFIYLLMALFFVALYFLMIRPQQKRRRAAETMQREMGPGDEIVTVGGLYGTIVEIDTESVLLEIAPGVEAKYARQAIARTIAPAAQPVDADEAFEEEELANDELEEAGPLVDEDEPVEDDEPVEELHDQPVAKPATKRAKSQD